MSEAVAILVHARGLPGLLRNLGSPHPYTYFLEICIQSNHIPTKHRILRKVTKNHCCVFSRAQNKTKSSPFEANFQVWLGIVPSKFVFKCHLIIRRLPLYHWYTSRYLVRWNSYFNNIKFFTFIIAIVEKFTSRILTRPVTSLYIYYFS